MELVKQVGGISRVRKKMQDSSLKPANGIGSITDETINQTGFGISMVIEVAKRRNKVEK